MASLVLFILWIYLSWTICLAGSRWNYLLQEGKRLDQENRFKAISNDYRKFLVLLLLARCEEEAEKSSDHTFSAIDVAIGMAKRYNMPTHIAMDIMDEMERKGVMFENDDDRLSLDNAFRGRTALALLEKLDITGNNSYAMQMIMDADANGKENRLWLYMNGARHVTPEEFDVPLKELF